MPPNKTIVAVSAASQIIKWQVYGEAESRKKKKRVVDSDLKEGASKSKNCYKREDEAWRDKEGSQSYNYVWEGDGVFLDSTNE